MEANQVVDELLGEQKYKHKNAKDKNISQKIKRGNKKHKAKHINIFSSNAAQLKGKIDSFKAALNETQAVIFTLQETHYATKGQFKVDNLTSLRPSERRKKEVQLLGHIKH